MGSWFCDRVRLNLKALVRRGIYMTADLVIIIDFFSGRVLKHFFFPLEKKILILMFLSSSKDKCTPL